MYFSRFLSVAASVCVAALSIGAASAKEVGVAKRFVEDRTYLQVNAPAGLQTLILQRKDVKSREWVEHAQYAIQGPLKKYRIPVPVGYDRKTKWRIRGLIDVVPLPEDPGTNDPPSTPSHVFPGLILERYNQRPVQPPSEIPPINSVDSYSSDFLWKIDKLKLVPGFLLRLDEKAAKVVVTDDQSPAVVLAEKPLGDGRAVKMAVEGSHLYVLKIKGHTMVNNRTWNPAETPDPQSEPPTYVWDAYDISALPALSLVSSTEFSMEVSAGIASLLQRGGVDASIVFPKPGIAAVLINHTAWITDNLGYLPEGIPAVHQGIFNTQSTMEYTGYNGRDCGPSESSYLIPANSNASMASRRRSCPVFVVIDCRNPQVPQVGDPMFLGDRRTVYSTPLFFADGVVGLGYETVESLPSPLVRNSVRSYLQILAVGADGTVAVKPVQDLPGQLRSVEEFTVDHALVWTTTFGEFPETPFRYVKAQVSVYENNDVTLQAVAAGLGVASPEILGREMFLSSVSHYQFTSDRELVKLGSTNTNPGSSSVVSLPIKANSEVFAVSFDWGGRSYGSRLYSLWDGETLNPRPSIAIPAFERGRTLLELEFLGNTMFGLFDENQVFKLGFGN